MSPDYPVFVLTFCIFKKRTYVEEIVPAITEFKFRYFGHDNVVLHERDIRKAKGHFSILKQAQLRARFMADLNRLVENAKFKIVVSVINKDQLLLKKQRFDVYELAMKFGMERVARESWDGSSKDCLHFVAESRGRNEDKDLELEFRRICDGQNFKNEKYPFEIVFADKKARHPGMELADLVARPVGRHVLQPQQPNRAWEILERKLRRSPSGDVDGWGLKIFP